MFGKRRSRLFLIVAALSALSIYYLSSRGSWNVTELERIGQAAFKHGKQQPAVQQPVAVPVPPPVEPTGDVNGPDVQPPTILTAVDESLPATTSESLATSTSSRKLAQPTITGEELLVQDTDDADELVDEGSGRYEVQQSEKNKKARWEKPPVHFPLEDEKLITLPGTVPEKLPQIQATFKTESSAAKRDRTSKLKIIRESFQHAWNGYKKYGLPHDEVRPLSKKSADPFMGWGATLVDTLDTLWIMDLKNEFEEALLEVEKIDFTTSARKDIPLFETIIRYLGGLLAAYDLTDGKYPILLNKTEELAQILMGAFDTPNRMPMTFYNWAPAYTSRPHRAGAHVTMAELGSLSVEMTRLAQITGKHEYYDAIARITDELEEWQPNTLLPGLWPLKLDASGCKKPEEDEEDEATTKASFDQPSDLDTTDVDSAMLAEEKFLRKPEGPGSHIARQGPATDPLDDEQESLAARRASQSVLTKDCPHQGLSAEHNAKSQVFGIGGQADSTYEYFPKMFALLRGRNKQYQTMYEAAAQTIRKKLLFRPMIKDETREVLFAASHEMKLKAKDELEKDVVTYEVQHLSCFIGGMFGLGAKLFGIEDDLELAQQLTDGCVWAYSSMPAGVMAEFAAVVPCPGLQPCSWNETRWLEALDPKLEERFDAVEAWNKNQKAIYASSTRKEAQKLGTRPVIVVDEDSHADRKNLERRGSSDELLPTSPASSSDDESNEDGLDAVEETPSMHFVPKVALSHEEYVKARIQEERLPASYTKIFARHYGLRPEAIESVFYMWRLTGDDIWRRKGWKMFEAVQSATQTPVANAALKDVTSHLGELDDVMESFWLAETLKYFYLLFDEPTKWSLDDWVLNTEAHFLRIPD